MWSSLQEYHRPASLQSALRLLGRFQPRTVPLAGGTWLVSRRDPDIQSVVDLTGLNLAFIKKSTRLLRLGAMTTLQTLVEHPLIHETGNGLLSDTARRSAPLSIRNIATLGGALAVEGSTSEVLLALLALDARLVIYAPHRLVVGLDTLLANRPAHLPPQALLTEIHLPKLPNRSGTSFVEVSVTTRDRPIVNAVVVVSRSGSTNIRVRLVVGGVAPVPIRLPEVEQILTTHPFEEDLVSLAAQTVSKVINPPGDFRASAEYRRAMGGVVAERALRSAWEKAIEV